ncbi:MAG: hypothetical protein HFH73_02545 [Lachnospiraceae bacterium]|nr:hypothetical protein [Lachnospiraceae bacterium]
MCNDLISRSKLITDLMKQIPLAENIHDIKDIIERQNIAYNLDNVIEQLEILLQKEIAIICKNVSDASYLTGIIGHTMLVDAIEIVKSGGIIFEEKG